VFKNFVKSLTVHAVPESGNSFAFILVGFEPIDVAVSYGKPVCCGIILAITKLSYFYPVSCFLKDIENGIRDQALFITRTKNDPQAVLTIYEEQLQFLKSWLTRKDAWREVSRENIHVTLRSTKHFLYNDSGMFRGSVKQSTAGALSSSAANACSIFIHIYTSKSGLPAQADSPLIMQNGDTKCAFSPPTALRHSAANERYMGLSDASTLGSARIGRFVA
jgi:hypothetical protein